MALFTGNGGDINNIIEKALTSVDNPLDCTVYENQLTELRNFNYNTYCNTIVYGSPNLNDGTKQKEYNNCISSNHRIILLINPLFRNKIW